jgi:hypothetical protein
MSFSLDLAGAAGGLANRALPVGMRAALVLAAAACVDHRTQVPGPNMAAPAERPGHRPSDEQVISRARTVLLADAAEVLGAAAMDDVHRASAVIVVRGSTSFPQMMQQPDGSWKAKPPAVVAAIRSGGRWTRIGAGGIRTAMDAVTGRELDRLMGSPDFWTERPLASQSCTDPSGILVLVRKGARELMSPLPCGFAGAAGLAAEIVFNGRVA